MKYRKWRFEEKLDLNNGCMIWRAKHVFFYFAGIRILDVLRMKWSAIISDRLHYKMSKNNKTDSLKKPDKITKFLTCHESFKPFMGYCHILDRTLNIISISL